MRQIKTLKEMATHTASLKKKGKTLGLVPTMGALHEGHLSLVALSRKVADITIMSVFVNPIQFNDKKDLATYPRNEEQDLQAARSAGVDVVFIPSVEDMYPAGFDTRVSCGAITKRLEGAARKGHFDGVATVVARLFNICRPDHAFFGQKDAQQVLVIQQMVRDLAFSVKIHTAATVREKDGLALSSRNQRLTRRERTEAPLIYAGLAEAVDAFNSGEKDPDVLRQIIRKIYSRGGSFTAEYISIADRSCNEIVHHISDGALCSVACRMKSSGTRLIDNVFLGTAYGQ
ncbi:MAG: pantoate--beta-alanine ligase [Fibrobacterota bacterium]